jgi:16S rRNA A1518/A1519 N6-dimethyltransferase RsmA/KsgA/DIM1 with predicted DNA glycosylase/AP lyase activity
VSGISRKNFDTTNAPKETEQKFFALLHAGFAHKRKQLLPNLSVLYPKDALASAFEKCGIDERARAEDIPLQKWLELSKNLTSV